MTVFTLSVWLQRAKAVRSSKCMSVGSFLKQLLVIQAMEITIALRQTITKNMHEKKNVEINDEFRNQPEISHCSEEDVLL